MALVQLCKYYLWIYQSMYYYLPMNKDQTYPAHWQCDTAQTIVFKWKTGYPVYLNPIIRANRDQGWEISETTAGIHSWIQSEEPTAIDRRPNIIRVHTCLLSNMNHPAYTTSTLCRTLSADHNTMINALNSLYSFIPPSLSIKLTSRSLSKLKFSLNKCPKPSGQGFRPPQNQANARLNLENSSLKKCPKPSGQGFRPPPPNGQCPNRGGDLLKGASLTPSAPM